MFATFTDWSMDVPEEGVKTAEEMWPEIQAAGALSMRTVSYTHLTLPTILHE